VNVLCNCCSHFAALEASEWTMHLPSNVDMAIRPYFQDCHQMLYCLYETHGVPGIRGPC
jgi:hypothetical protein